MYLLFTERVLDRLYILIYLDINWCFITHRERVRIIINIRMWAGVTERVRDAITNFWNIILYLRLDLLKLLWDDEFIMSRIASASLCRRCFSVSASNRYSTAHEYDQSAISSGPSTFRSSRSLVAATSSTQNKFSLSFKQSHVLLQPLAAADSGDR